VLRRARAAAASRAATGSSRGRIACCDGLAPREAEALALIAEGLANGKIADRLVMEPGDGEEPREPRVREIGARDRDQAVAYAYRSGLAPSP
jgi:DNA-binding NarL/FixJ family response regulator